MFLQQNPSEMGQRPQNGQPATVSSLAGKAAEMEGFFLSGTGFGIAERSNFV
jgi:hypothetical protein